MENSLKVGVIGLGRIGKVHLENLVYRTPNAQVVAVANPSSAPFEVAKNLGVTNTYNHAEEVIHHKEVEAIFICSPTPTHKNLIQEAAEAGKHIFCEKPLDMTVAAIEEINATVAQANVKLQVGFNRRFDSNFRKVRQQVANGSIGDAHILKITSRDPAPPDLSYIQSSGGLFMDMTIHDFDMARFIVGSEVEEVYAKADVLVDPQIGQAGDIDTAVVTLTFKNGCLGVIDNSRKAVYGYDQRLEIFGSKGMSRIENNHGDTEMFFDQTGGHRGVPYHFFMDRYTDSFCLEIQEFIRAVKDNLPVAVDGNDALQATKIALAANASLQSNRPVILDNLKT